MKQIVVGLTGGIGAGKSTVARFLSDLGAAVVSGDDLGRELLDRDATVRQTIVQKLGAEVLNADGSLNRRRMATLVFAESTLSKWLTQATFPGIHRLWSERKLLSTSRVLVLDAALIFEWEIEDEFDIVLVVTAPPTEIVSRAEGRFAADELARRTAAQLPAEKKLAGAAHIITNDGTLDDLYKRVTEFWNEHILTRLT
ncbi:MAG: dephospho-CoA kinase [bacterium]|nr:dephospho-CoA kinase [bacterium]